MNYMFIIILIEENDNTIMKNKNKLNILKKIFLF